MALLTCGLVSAALLSQTAPALAQTSQTPPKPDDGSSSEIVVTATRHAEVLSKVPQSVTAYNQAGMDARGVKGIADITRLTPGIELNASGFGTNSDISIRGISSLVGASTTGIYIDDTPIQTRVLGYSATNTYPLVFDLERVEVLRGPQGTLFGAGSEGGTVRFITPQPSLTKSSDYARAELSGTDGGDASYELGFALGGPVIDDQLGIRVSFWVRHDGGYIDRKNANPQPGFNPPVYKNANGINTQVGRAAATWAPIDDLTITPSIFYQNRETDDIGTFWEGLSLPGTGKFVNGQPLAQPDHDHFILPALNVNYEFGGMTLISNTSLFQREDDRIDDYSTLNPAIFSAYTPPGYYFAGPNWVPDSSNFGQLDTSYQSPTTMRNKQKVWTEELRLQSSDPNARLNWVAGLFLSKSRQDSDQTILDPRFAELFGLPVGTPVGLIDNLYSAVGTGKSEDKQAALFAEGNYRVTDKLKLTAGVRVARTSFAGSAFATGPFSGTVVQPEEKVTETPVTPKAGISYQADDNNLFYVTAAKGYRIGGTNPTLPTFCDVASQGYTQAPTRYASDSLWSYELGSKNRLFDRRLEVSASAYHINWSNIQQLVYISNCGSKFVDNLGKATSNGFDFQLAAHPTTGLTLEAAVGYTHATYAKTIPSLVEKGDHIDTHPWSVNLALAYEHPVSDTSTGYFRADYSYHSQSAQTVSLNPANGSYDPGAVPTPETNYLTLRGGIRLPTFDVSVFIDNATNADPYLTRYSEVVGNPVYRDFTFRPRTVGITVTYRN
jgi:outer membrane receptor protein involved in Fe transport